MRRLHWKRRIQAAFGQDARTRGEFIAMAGLTAEEVAAADRESVLPGRIVVHLEGERHADGRPNVTDKLALVSCRACFERATGKRVPKGAWPRATSAEREAIDAQVAELRRMMTPPPCSACVPGMPCVAHGEPDDRDDPDYNNAQRVDYTRQTLERLAGPTGRAERSAR